MLFIDTCWFHDFLTVKHLCPHWIHLTASMRDNRNCCSFFLIFESLDHVHYILKCCYGSIPNSSCSKLLIASTKETPCFSVLQISSLFLSATYMTGLHSEGIKKADLSVRSATGPHRWNPWGWRALSIFTGTSEWFQLSNLRTNALWPWKCQLGMKKMNTISNCIFLYNLINNF